MKRRLFLPCAALLAWMLAPGDVALGATPEGVVREPSKLHDPADGWLDLSAFLDESYGFAPIVLPITEPALGYGAAGALVFMNEPGHSGPGGRARPDITALGGLGTENGTWGVFGLDSRSWLDGRLQSIVAVLYADLQLDYFGLGGEGRLRDQPLAYRLSPAGGRAQVRYRLGDSRANVGLAYTLSRTEVEFEAVDRAAELPAFESEAWLGGVTPSFSYDSRNALFTPTRGVFFETMLDVYGQAFGGDDDFQRADGVVLGYYPVRPNITLGARTSATASFDDAPFYMRPYVYMRGIAAMRYQGEHVAQVEGEVRYQCWKRFSVVGFGGVGSAWSDVAGRQNTQTVEALGTGFRYELARRYALHVGLDVAWGPDDPAFYVQFGSAWMRL